MKKGYLFKIICLIISVIFVTVTFTGCTKKAEDNNNFTVVTSFYPMYVFTKNITEGAQNVTVENMTAADAGCLHDYQLLPKDLKKLENADMFVVNGAGMESFLEKAMESIPSLNVITASENIEILKHDVEENPHVWMYIPNAVRQIENITAVLCEYDASNKEVYQKNSEAYIEKLNEIHNEFLSASKEFNNKNIIVTHEAFDYMADGYGFNIIGSVMNEHNSEPTAAELSKLVSDAKALNIAAIFKEPQYPETAVNTVSKEADVPVYTLDPMVTGVEGEYEKVFENVMKENLDILKKALR